MHSREVLRHIEDALNQSMEQVQAKEKTWSEAAATSRSGPHLVALAAQAEKARSLQERGSALSQRAEISDQELLVCEQELRDLSTRTESLRRKLAEWVGRAIG